MDSKLNTWLCRNFDREKTETDEFGAPQDDDSRLRPDLKEAEEKMFNDISKRISHIINDVKIRS